jgi:hypothetical protein
VIGGLVALGLLVPARRMRGLAVVALVAAILSAGASGAAYAAVTATVAHTGSIPNSGQASQSGMRGGPGGMRGGATDNNAELTALLTASTTKWSAAISGATSAAGLELSSGTSVIALGGWNGSDPSPTLAEFQAYVAAGQIPYFIAGGGMGGGGNGTSTESGKIAAWVAANYTATTVGGTTVYDLTSA